MLLHYLHILKPYYFLLLENKTSITTYYYMIPYFVLLQNYFHITSILLPINAKPRQSLLHITTRQITSDYFKITSILLHHYFQLLLKIYNFVLLPSALLRITFCLFVQTRMRHYHVLQQYAITSLR